MNEPPMPDALTRQLQCNGPKLEEAEMLLHLPIILMATLSPTPISEKIPKLDVARECRFESDASNTFDRCSDDESDALQTLRAEWPQFGEADRRSCLAEATVAGVASYVELLICLEMARDVANQNDGNSRGSVAKKGSPSTSPGQPEVAVVDKRD